MLQHWNVEEIVISFKHLNGYLVVQINDTDQFLVSRTKWLVIRVSKGGGGGLVMLNTVLMCRHTHWG